MRKPGKYEPQIAALQPGESVQLEVSYRVGCVVASQYGRTWGREFHVERPVDGVARITRKLNTSGG